MAGSARPLAVNPVLLLVVAVGAGLGALLSYGVTTAWPPQAGHIPWGTFVVGITGCAAIGILMVLSTEVWVAHRLLRPFLGVGVPGRFTTYSAETHTLLDSGAMGEAPAYLGGNHGGMPERCRAQGRPGAMGSGQGAVDNVNGMTERVAGQ